MKKLVIIALAFVSVQAMAQDRKHKKGDRQDKMAQYTPEQIAELQTKQMTLELDLSDAQQKDVQKINLENAQLRKQAMDKRREMKENNAERPSKEAMLKYKNDKLDQQIATKRKMKDILNEEQYSKWEKSLEKRSMYKRKGQRKMARKELN
ncbi:hypothetical protein GCM10022271_12470 [Corallibacter vietnamensis]|uniref:DUF4890 domain-containing protein n=1 Tax=Corallibacter vietnamensis TaxID=904130 RepID=A0ABP7H1A2_9FLAO